MSHCVRLPSALSVALLTRCNRVLACIVPCLCKLLARALVQVSGFFNSQSMIGRIQPMFAWACR
jgi:hypothetical protein